MSRAQYTAQQLFAAFARDHQHNNIVIPNVYVGGNRLESDIVLVRPSGYFAEVEIKLSIADLKADFRKSRYGTFKHACLWHSKMNHRRLMPSVPREFYFLLPEALYSKAYEHIPECYGVYLYKHLGKEDVVWQKKRSKVVTHARKLGTDDIFKLSVKLSRKLSVASEIRNSRVIDESVNSSGRPG